MLNNAFRFLIYDKPKSIGALFGIIISIFLIGQQVGIYLFLTGLMAGLPNSTQGKVGLWVINSATQDANSLGLLDSRLQRQVESIPGVAKAYPLVVAAGQAKFESGETAAVTIIGSQYPAFKGGAWNLSKGSMQDILQEGAFTCDEFDEKTLGGATLGTQFELGGKKAFIAAQTRGARGFGGAYAFTTLERARAYGQVSPDKVSALLIDLEPNADTLTVRDRINATVFGVKAWKTEDLSASTVSFILSTSGIAISTGTLIVFAIISGLIIIGLTLYSATIDRIRDYATLKAIGSTNGFITRLILLQCVILAFIGYIFSTVLLQGFKFGIGQGGVLFEYTPTIRIGFFVVTFVISVFGAIFAIRRITKIEPAAVFRG
ncbi:MAG: FtsX-like permease family protein [Candidatus Kapabacteria bacterium]|jgi:putative ABC transport system permease protein|nr:FtsX-like permease family protein [Candidatus Kapabacteria bacterium]